MPRLWSLLQWGRAPMSAEIADVGSERAPRHRASMGPRSDERGNMTTKRKPHKRPLTLQWGRAPMSAEIHPEAAGVSGIITLQWGRAPMFAPRLPHEGANSRKNPLNYKGKMVEQKGFEPPRKPRKP